MGNLGTLSIIGILFAMLTSSCGVERSNRERNRGSQEQESELFAPARQVLEAKCMNCHDNWDGFSESRFFEPEGVETNEPLVIPGDVRNSILIRALQQNGGRMPKDKRALSTSEVAALTSWIESLE